MRIVKYSLGALFVLYFQLLIASNLSIMGIVPFFLLPFVVFISMNLKLIESSTITFILALANDLYTPHLLGINVFILLIICFLVTKYHASVNKDKFGPVAISLLLINLLYLLPLLPVKAELYGYETKLLRDFFIGIVYNSIITFLAIMIFNVIQKLRVVIDV
ncbi:MAG: rod shape-determining protein MreD [Candidatus Cloacimonetes bacterium]|nr:rod shape-determining protein MreD [Candidatus Cloacimonadota bacterium]